jgi:acyl-CoA synthetase (AMP-forming)/AMP-acid ligase II
MPPVSGSIPTRLWTSQTDPASVVIWQDSKPITSASFEKGVQSLCQLLLERQVRRWALRSARADHIATAVAATELAGCEVLLTRAMQPRPAEVWQSWNVSLVLDEQLQPEWSGSSNALPSEGPHILVETSGTTGVPKVARHRLDALMGRLRAGRSAHGKPRWLLTYHPAGFGGLQVLLTALCFGEPLVATTRPSVSDLARAALEHKPTHISATPTFWRGFLMALGDAAGQLPLEQITLGGEIAEQSLLDQLRSAFPRAGLTHIYASSEAGAVFAVRDGLAGFPASWLEAGIDGVGLRVREGVLEVLSPREMKSYVDDTPMPRTPDGWIRTGDVLEVRAGRAYFQGRQDSLISVGGSKVMPEEVEGVLMSVPGVLDARVYGVKNPVTGYFMAAEIVTSEPDHKAFQQKLLAAARAALDSYKVPRQIRFVDRLELSATGKKKRTE